MGLLDRFRKKSPKRNKDTGTAMERYEKSFFHAIDGIVYGIRFEHNMIIILVAAILVIVFGIFYKLSGPEWLFVITMIGTISAVEVVNSSIEAAIDLTTTEIHPLAKIAKDCGSASTFVLTICAVIVCLFVFVPYFIG